MNIFIILFLLYKYHFFIILQIKKNLNLLKKIIYIIIKIERKNKLIKQDQIQFGFITFKI